MPRYFHAAFSSDVTPPLGHPLCGGWIEPARAVDDPLKAIGLVLLGPDKPIVLCAVDWVGLRNGAYRQWRAALAEAAHTTPERVAIHCVHPHNTPFADVDAQAKIATAKAPISLDLAFFERAVMGSAEALRKALPNAVPFTHFGTGSAKVAEVASNRRVLGPDGKVKFTRTSATKNAEARNAAEGLIDPILRTLSLWDGERQRASLHFYATHPMSYYGDGRVSADFCGLARQKKQDEIPGVHHLYFTGAAGNVTAGKYNDGEKANRNVLRDRIVRAMTAAAETTVRHPIAKLDWRVEPVPFKPRRESSFGQAESLAVLNDPKATAAKRNNAAFQLAWLDRIELPIELTCLNFGDRAKILHLPGEPFIEYQLAAQKMRPESFICVAGYGDGGPGYIPTERAFLEGGYEPTVALAAPEMEGTLRATIAKLLDVDPRKARP